MPVIHPTASVSPEAQLADNVQIGPFCVVSGPARLGPGVRLMGHVYLSGPVTIGDDSIVYPFACIGFPPQDVKFKPGDKTAGVVIGKQAQIREHATIHSASNEHTPTTVGDRIFMMVNTHLGHDVRVGNNVTMVNNAAVGGHGQVHDSATLGGGALVHQFCRVGRLAMMSGGVAVSTDVPPFCTVDDRNRIVGINQVGLRRAGMPREQITEVRRAFRDLLRSPVPRDEMLKELEARGKACPPVAELHKFIAETKRSICPGHGKIPRFMVSWMARLRQGDADISALSESGAFDDE